MVLAQVVQLSLDPLQVSPVSLGVPQVLGLRPGGGPAVVGAILRAGVTVKAGPAPALLLQASCFLHEKQQVQDHPSFLIALWKLERSLEKDQLN